MARVSISRSHNDKMTEVVIGDLTIWFSYETPVALHTPVTGYVVSQNNWSATTGRHLNSIDGGRKADRVTREKFQQALQTMTDALAVGIEGIDDDEEAGE